jgi:hypothetical protein
VSRANLRSDSLRGCCPTTFRKAELREAPEKVVLAMEFGASRSSAFRFSRASSIGQHALRRLLQSGCSQKGLGTFGLLH